MSKANDVNSSGLLAENDGPPYCMNCCGLGYVRITSSRWPWELVDCMLCNGTGRAKDHPADEQDQRPEWARKES